MPYHESCCHRRLCECPKFIGDSYVMPSSQSDILSKRAEIFDSFQFPATIELSEIDYSIPVTRIIEEIRDVWSILVSSGHQVFGRRHFSKHMAYHLWEVAFLSGSILFHITPDTNAVLLRAVVFASLMHDVDRTVFSVRLPHGGPGAHYAFRVCTESFPELSDFAVDIAAAIAIHPLRYRPADQDIVARCVTTADRLTLPRIGNWTMILQPQFLSGGALGELICERRNNKDIAFPLQKRDHFKFICLPLISQSESYALHDINIGRFMYSKRTDDSFLTEIRSRATKLV